MSKYIFIIVMGICLWCSAIGTANAATSLPFTVNMSEATNVDTAGGTPRIAVNVGGVTRYASYTSGTGTSALTFTYEAVAGDVDLDGITLTSPVDLNGGTMTDAAGNNATLTFTLPTTTGVRVDYPSLSMDFTNGATGRYTLNGTAYTTLSSFLSAAGGSFTRASTGTYFDSTGTLQTAASGTARFDHDPVSLTPKGLMIESPRTNYVKNSQFAGITTGGPYTTATVLGTYWQTMGAGAFPSSSITITGTGTLNGIPYLDIRFQGTNSTGAISYITFNTLAADKFAVVNGDTTITSAWMAVTAYTSTGGTAGVNIQSRSYTSGGVYAGGAQVLYNATSPWQKVVTPVLTHGATAATADGWIYLSVPNAVTVDITVRLGGIQVERGGYATSYIPTTNAVGVRQGDLITIPTGAWYNQSAGSFAGSVAWQSMGGTFYPMFFRFDDTGNNNRWNFYYAQISNKIGVDAYNGGVQQGTFAPVPVSGTSGNVKMATAQALNSTNTAFNGTLGTVDTSWTPPTVTQFIMLNTGNANRWFEDFKYYPLRVADPQLQLLTQ